MISGAECGGWGRFGRGFLVIYFSFGGGQAPSSWRTVTICAR
jgi:hypothetical protein